VPEFTKLTLAVLVAAVAGCGRSKLVAPGPIHLDTTPREIVFVEPVRGGDQRRELCLEFDPPGGSLQASRVHVVLLSTTGAREIWHKPSVDRRGEATVCLVEGTSAPRPDSGAALDYRGVELSSDVPLSVRQIRWRMDD
jgi:hypothetical protein